MPASKAPLVSVLVLNCNGREHLQACLPSLEAQVYPKDRLQIEVIDNGSSDGSVELLARRFPHVRVHRRDRNYGFAEPYDSVARASDADYVAFLNNDTRVEPMWVTELVAAADRHQADCVGSRILDWDGRHIDFVGGLVSFIGHSWQRDTGAPADRAEEDRPLLFACGGSMLIKRDVYVDAGGFDGDFFAYFEDVDLGWRLAVLGYKTVLAPKAVTYHRLHGTAGKIAFAQRLRLYERNALAMIYKNYETETLRRVLPAAVALSLVRGLAQSGIDSRTFALGSTPPPATDITTRSAVYLLALEDFCRQLPSLNQKRAAIQSHRRVSDRDVFALFGEPFRLHEEGPYAEIAHTLIRDLAIEGLFEAGDQARSRVGAGFSPPSAGPADRLRPPLAALVASAVRHSCAAAQLAKAEAGPYVSLAGPPASTPLVSVVILTVLGPTYLPDCLSSLRAQTYPADRVEVLVVDNASAEDPTATVRAHYPAARVIRNPTNVGFSVGNNIGAKAATGEYVVFLNDDTRVHPDFLRELVGTAIRRGAVSVGSRILTWDGKQIDFVGGSVNFEGRGFQTDIGQPEAGRHTDECPLLFACGGAMLARRDVFLESGGWDEDAFAYYEDLEIGWRFWLFGHEVWFSPRSIVYHLHHGTWGRWPEPPRLRLYERNSLRILYSHLERETLERVLPAALLLAVDRALLSTELSRAARDAEEVAADERAGRGRRPPRLAAWRASIKAALRDQGVTRRQSLVSNLRRLGPRRLVAVARQVVRGAGAPLPLSRRSALQIERGAAPFALDGRAEPVPTSAAAALCGVRDFLSELPQLSTRRHAFQAARRRSDREILSQFATHWIDPAVSPHQLVHEEVHRDLVEALGIREILSASS